MMEDSRASLPMEIVRQIDAICDRFEEAWLGNQRPRIEDCLPEVDDAHRSALLRELLRVELECRLRAGDEPAVEGYRRRFPEDGKLVELLFRQVRRNVESIDETRDVGQSLKSPSSDLAATIDQPITEKAGTQIGPYKLLQELGEGGMGVVYMADQIEPVKRRVAVKIIKPGMDTRQVIARFEAERQALAMMDHPNIAKVLDAGTTESGRPYFVMELVKGIPITKYCDQQRLTPKERLDLFIPVCQAVQHAHQKGIIHRDLKPSNVLIALYDGKPVSKVIDFGLVKATSQKLTEKTMFTQFGQIVGTLEYMSPEQAELNQLDIDTRSDIYSLGVLLYELLTGNTPFDGKRLRSAAFEEMMRIIREEEPPKPSTRLSSIDTLPTVAANRQTEPKRLNALIRGELDWIVMKALEKDRTRRYETANGLARDIERYLDDEPIEAGPPSATYKLRRLVRKHRVVLTTAAAFAVLLVAGVVVSTWQAYRATKAEGLAQHRLEQVTDERNRSIRAQREAVQERNRATEAEEGVKAALAESEQAREQAESVAAFLVEVFESPDPERDGRTITVAEMLDRAVERLKTELQDQPQRVARLLQAIGRTYSALDLTDRAIPLHEELRIFHERTSGLEHPDTLTAKSTLALSCDHAGLYDEALRLNEEVLKLRRQVLGPKHDDTLTTMRHLAAGYRHVGRYEDAAKLGGAGAGTAS